MIPHTEMKSLLKKFINGSRWLDLQKRTQRDVDEFKERVTDPIAALWPQLTGEQQGCWNKTVDLAQMFKARIK